MGRPACRTGRPCLRPAPFSFPLFFWPPAPTPRPRPPKCWMRQPRRRTPRTPRPTPRRWPASTPFWCRAMPRRRSACFLPRWPRTNGRPTPCLGRPSWRSAWPTRRPHWRQRWRCARFRPTTRWRRWPRAWWPRWPGGPKAWTCASSPWRRKPWPTAPPATPPSNSASHWPRFSPAGTWQPPWRCAPTPASSRPFLWWARWPRSGIWPTRRRWRPKATAPFRRRFPVPSGQWRCAPSPPRTGNCRWGRRGRWGTSTWPRWTWTWKPLAATCCAPPATAPTAPGWTVPCCLTGGPSAHPRPLSMKLGWPWKKGSTGCWWCCCAASARPPWPWPFSAPTASRRTSTFPLPAGPRPAGPAFGQWTSRRCYPPPCLSNRRLCRRPAPRWPPSWPRGTRTAGTGTG